MTLKFLVPSRHTSLFSQTLTYVLLWRNCYDVTKVPNLPNFEGIIQVNLTWLGELIQLPASCRI